MSQAIAEGTVARTNTDAGFAVGSRQKALKREEATTLREMAEAGMLKVELAPTYAIGRETVYPYTAATDCSRPALN